MTALLARTETILRQSNAAAYDMTKAAAKLDAGLVAGDAVKHGSDLRIVFVGGSTVRKERLVSGAWTVEAEMDAPAPILESVLVSAAADAARI